MASIQVSSISTTSFRARLTGLDSTYPRTDRTAWWELYRGSTRVANPSQSLGAKISSSSYQSFTGLTPNTSYTLSCYIDYTDAEGNWHKASVSYSGTITTDSLPTPSVTLTTTVLSHNAIRARFTYDSKTWFEGNPYS